ncbi:F0F1 ATP synthase subunit B [Gloeocapsa sp. PCC 73106]|uniref:F0F1 ATP synthase subunit B n=1 Tax=Gloeocapsa sp. PCC 73106 TaxID=102232 RepID=UPI0002AC9F77|nr:F0F1 ATP synthase subunit B [Gloeocapsa sp. PCC 73106]ELR98745.1 ATP synthase, F0 subunit b [Gloeocapsa sp. PCC 73106]
MGTFYYLANEGFGLNFNILETNLINLAILIGLLLFYGRKFISNLLTERRSKIEAEITNAEQRAQTAAAALAEAQQKLAQAQTEAEQIRQNALSRAQTVKESILAQGKVEVEKLQVTASQELTTETTKVIAQIKEQIVALALNKAESQLKGSLNDSVQTKLIERSVAQLGGRS